MTLIDIRQTQMRRGPRGYVRQLGRRKIGGPLTKFYLSNDLGVAAQRRQWIEEIYLENCRAISENNFLEVEKTKLWRSSFLGLAKQIAKHGNAITSVPEAKESVVQPGFKLDYRQDLSCLDRLRSKGVPIEIIGDAFATVQLPGVTTPENKPATKKLHEEIDRYLADRTANYVGSYGGKERVRKQIEKFKVTADCWLHEFDFNAIKGIIDHWRSRPKTATGKVCSKSYAKNQIAEFFKFINWLDSSCPEFSLPNMNAINRRVPTVLSDSLGNEIKSMHWTPKDLKEVFKNSQPLTQLMIALGLNTCSGAAELGRFTIESFVFDQQHPKANLIRFSGPHSWLITTRQKSNAHSEALLWPWVAELLKEQVEICKLNGWHYIFTDNGEPLYRDNAIYTQCGLPIPNTTKPESRFVKRFDNAVSLAFKENRIERKLSLGKLRKTFANYLADQNHADLASLALSHQTDSDQLLKHYANKPYRRLFNATMEAQPIWDLTKSG